MCLCNFKQRVCLQMSYYITRVFIDFRLHNTQSQAESSNPPKLIHCLSQLFAGDHKIQQNQLQCENQSDTSALEKKSCVVFIQMHCSRCACRTLGNLRRQQLSEIKRFSLWYNFLMFTNEDEEKKEPASSRVLLVTNTNL